MTKNTFFKLLSAPFRLVSLVTPSRLQRLAYYLRRGQFEIVTDRVLRLMKVGTAAHLKLVLYKPTDRPGRLVFPPCDEPLVSIVIPVHNQWGVTRACLVSILENTSDLAYEVIVADDCSSDETRNLSEHAENVKSVVNGTNVGFLRNCNRAAREARGKYLVFLNNDTNVQPGWLTQLLDVFHRDPKAGLVGSMLLYPDGRLQEAGGIIWQDASGWNYGRLDYPERPEFNYLKEVDYISGAAIMVRKSLWDELGGFDERFAPAYYEDADLAFEIRRIGYKVIYQPLSKVVHFEGVSHGTDVSAGGKAHQVANRPKFLAKWRQILDSGHGAGPQDLFLARDRSAGKRTLLFIDHYVPLHDRDAGSRSVFHYLRLMAEMGYNIKFIGDNFVDPRPYTTTLEQLGIEVLYGAAFRRNWEKWLSINGKYIDYVWLSRPHIARKYLPAVKRHTRAKRIYLGHDLHFLRESRQCDIGGHALHEKAASRWERVENEILHDVSVSYFVSEFEVSEIRRRWPEVSARVIPITLLGEEEIHRDVPPFESRHGLLFVGGFMHEPNVDGLLWFIRDILPMVRASQPDIQLAVVGAAAPPKLTRLAGPGIVFRGWVSDEELAGLYRTCRAVVAPLRFGAGVKGKIVEAMCQGVPVVTTSIGAEGIAGGGEALLVADTPEAFADEVLRLYSTPELWQQFAERATQSVAKHVSASAAREIFLADMPTSVQLYPTQEPESGPYVNGSETVGMLSRVLRQITPARWWLDKGKPAFVNAIPRDGRVLDVGCGNNSPQWFKTVRPDLYYVGIDVGNYNQALDPYRFADDYVLCGPDEFAGRIEAYRGQMDAVVSAHNLEHCNEPDRVLRAMVNALRPGGKLYLAFPCEESVGFPHRGGCLNFYDDATHKTVPSWNDALRDIQLEGGVVEFAAKRYRRLPQVLRGLLLEPLSAYRRCTIPDGSTWALYGFESVIWATVPPAGGALEKLVAPH